MQMIGKAAAVRRKRRMRRSSNKAALLLQALIEVGITVKEQR
jgi:hypothetical protein